MDTSIQYRKMTQSEAFAILHSLFDIAVANDEAMPTDEITLDTRICDLYWIGDDMTFGAYGKAGVLEPLFGIKVPMREWRKAISPGRKKTVADLCNFLVAHAMVPVIPAPSLLGRPCQAAGAFQAVRQLLAEKGVETNDLRPSSPLEDFARVGFPKVWRDLIRIAPSLLLRIRWDQRWDLHFMLIAIPFLFSTIIGGLVSQNAPAIGIPLAIGSFLAFVLIWRLSKKRAILAQHMSFHGMTTFRDLCKFMVDANTTDLSSPKKD